MENLAWGTDSELTDEQFYNRERDIILIKSLLKTTENGSPPTIMLSGIRGVGKTVLLKKIKKELDDDYLIAYIDLSETLNYQLDKLTEIGIIQNFYQTWMKSSEDKKISTIFKKIEEQIKTIDFELKGFSEIGKYPVPIVKRKNDYKKLAEFVLNLLQKIYDENPKYIKGVIMIIDEFQVLKELGNKLDYFLWGFRSFIQRQKNVAYVFSGSVNSTDIIIDKIAGNDGAFDGRILTIQINPFSKETASNYLSERIPSLNFEDDGFERFYKCSKGIPYYVNTFAKLLPKDTILNNDNVTEEFKKVLPLLSINLRGQWSRLTLQQQRLITTIIDEPLDRKNIALKLNLTSGSLSKSLSKLLKIDLIQQEYGKYSISDHILRAWLKQEFDEKGIIPYRG